MKLLINRQSAEFIIDLCVKAVPSRCVKPALSCIKLEAKGKELRVSATDMESSVQCSSAQVDIEAEGQCLIPADLLRHTIHSSIDDVITFRTGDGPESLDLTALTANSKIRMRGHPVDEFPPIGFDLTDDAVKVPAGELATCIDVVRFAAAKSPHNRFAISGVRFERSKGKPLTVVATDGNRMSWAKIEVVGDAGFGFTVPLKGLDLLNSLLHSTPDDVCEIKWSSSRARFSVGVDGVSPVQIGTGMLDGIYPPYGDVVPKNLDRSFRIDRDTLSRLLNQVCMFRGSDGNKEVILSCASKKLFVRSVGAEDGEGSADIACDCEDFPEYYFSYDRLNEAVKACSDSFLMSLKAEAGNKAITIKNGLDRGSSLIVIVPLLPPSKRNR